jgi:hypothetical protein
MMPRLRNHIWAGLVVLAFSASAVWAQDNGNQTPPVAPLQQNAPPTGAPGSTGDTSGNGNQGGDTEQNPIPAKVELEAPPASSAAIPSLVAGSDAQLRAAGIRLLRPVRHQRREHHDQ